MSLKAIVTASAVLTVALVAACGFRLPTSVVAAPKESVESLKEKQEQIRRVVESAMPATVVVTDGIGSGSGVIVSEDGLVLTAAHVLMTDGPELKVIFADGRQVKATALGSSLDVDAGMLRLEEPGPWPYVPLDDQRSAKAGDWCVALGHPGGYQLGRTPPVRVGRVLANDRTVVMSDCALIGGDSGGPLFDLEGRLIGIHSSIGESVDQNRHVPISAFREGWDRMLSGEQWGQLGRSVDLAPNRPMLGVRLGMLDNDRVVVAGVVPDSPAEKAGLMEGDLILRVDGVAVTRPIELMELVASHEVGDSVKLQIEREGKSRNIQVDLTRSGELDLSLKDEDSE